MQRAVPGGAVWYDKDSYDNFGGNKMSMADVINGKLTESALGQQLTLERFGQPVVRIPVGIGQLR
jgi:hypothetical protein